MKFRYFLSHKALFLIALMLIGVTPKAHSFSLLSFFGSSDQKTTTKPAISRPVATRPMVKTVAPSTSTPSFSVVKTLKKYCARTRKAMTAFFSTVIAELTKEDYAQLAATTTVATIRHVNSAPAVAQPATRAGAAPRIKTYAERRAELQAQKEAKERAVLQRIEQLRQAEEERKRIEAARMQELRAERLRKEQVAQARATIARQQREQAARSRAAAHAPAEAPSCLICLCEEGNESDNGFIQLSCCLSENPKFMHKNCWTHAQANNDRCPSCRKGPSDLDRHGNPRREIPTIAGQ